MNWISILVSALAPLLIGFVWYSEKGFANVWMREGKLDKEDFQKGNLFSLLSFAFLFSFFLSVMIQFIVVHQTGAFGMVGGEPEKALPSYAAFMADYGTVFRTFKHGALHGFMASILFALPIIAINARFERKS